MRSPVSPARFRILALVGAVLGVGPAAGCAATAVESGPGAARRAVPGLTARSCHFANDPERPIGLDRLLRLGTRGSLGLWGVGMGPGDTAVVSVRYGEDGRIVWARSIQSSLPEAARAELERVLLAGLRQEGPPDWGTRMFVAGGDLVAARPSVLCPAEPRSEVPSLQVAGPVSRRDYAAMNAVRGQRFEVELSLDAAGRIMGLRLLRSSGYEVVDQFIRDWVLATSFFPKLHDGIGVPTTYTETLYIPRRP